MKAAIESGGHTVIEIEANEQAYLRFLDVRKKIKMVFNQSEGLPGLAREAQVPSMLDMLGIPFTHSGPLTQAISLDKTLTKKVLAFDGIPTPRFQLIKSTDDQIDPRLTFPLLVKPNAEGSSIGIFNENLVFEKAKLIERIDWLLSKFSESVLVEEYIDGREFTVSVLGNYPPRVLPIVEQNFSIFPESMPHFASFEAKWLFEDTLPDPHKAYFCPAPISEKLKTKIEDLCLRVYDLLDVKDVCRIDLRADKNENIYFIELNTIPGMIPDPNVVTYFPIAGRKAGFSYEGLVNTILNNALKRYGIVNEKQYHLISKPFLPASFLHTTA